jgi:hypothetical protein
MSKTGHMVLFSSNKQKNSAKTAKSWHANRGPFSARAWDKQLLSILSIRFIVICLALTSIATVTCPGLGSSSLAKPWGNITPCYCPRTALAPCCCCFDALLLLLRPVSVALCGLFLILPALPAVACYCTLLAPVSERVEIAAGLPA